MRVDENGICWETGPVELSSAPLHKAISELRIAITPEQADRLLAGTHILTLAFGHSGAELVVRERGVPLFPSQLAEELGPHFRQPEPMTPSQVGMLSTLSQIVDADGVIWDSPSHTPTG